MYDKRDVSWSTCINSIHTTRHLLVCGFIAVSIIKTYVEWHSGVHIPYTSSGFICTSFMLQWMHLLTICTSRMLLWDTCPFCLHDWINFFVMVKLILFSCFSYYNRSLNALLCNMEVASCTVWPCCQMFLAIKLF